MAEFVVLVFALASAIVVVASTDHRRPAGLAVDTNGRVVLRTRP